MKDRIGILNTISFWIIGVTVFVLPILFLPANILPLSQIKITLITVSTSILIVLFLIESLNKVNEDVSLLESATSTRSKSK